MRFDNYDDIWDVKTSPHHSHIRGMKKVIESYRESYERRT